MNILGISSFYHDSSACLVREGQILAAAQEERFSRIKNTSAFPIHAINFCIQKAGLSFDQIDAICFFEKPYLKFARALVDHLDGFPWTFQHFLHSIPKWLDERLTLPLVYQNELGYRGKTYFLKHHLSHAASAFLPSGFEEAAILTADGVGEWATVTCGRGKGNEIFLEREIQYPDSLGLLYTAFTTFLGFHANGGEGKTMGLAGYGRPSYLPQLREIVQVREDGSFRVNSQYFRFRARSRMWSPAFEKVFGPARIPNSPITQRHYDLASSVQALLEDILLKMAKHLHRTTGLRRLCVAGGVMLNCVANMKILQTSGFDEIFVQPAAGDAGGALGAALYLDHCVHGTPRAPQMAHAFLGPEFSEREMLRSLRASGVHFRKVSEEELLGLSAKALGENKTLGWFQGRMEYGPRALGNRSILANPCFVGVKDQLNEKIKKREAFRPYAPIVLVERARDYFDLPCPSPFMLLAPQVRADKAPALPGITHADGTARVQTVDQDSNPRMQKLLVEFEKRSGVPMLVNTSFNRQEEPVVCLPDHALACFLGTQMDYLALGDFWVDRSTT